MSKQANPTIVGAFVLIGLAIALGAIMIFGHFKFKDNTLRCVAYFTGSLHGLDIGAPVTFRGVAIGRVSSIQIQYDNKQSNYLIPVYIDIQQATSPNGGMQEYAHQDMEPVLRQLIDQGLKAQLKINSLLTGKLYVDLILRPEAETIRHHTEVTLLEIPTLPSGLEQITEKLESLPMDEILNKVANTLDGIDHIINSDESRKALNSLNAAIERVNLVLTKVDAQLPGLMTEAKKGVADFSATMNAANRFMHLAGRELEPRSKDLHTLLITLDTASKDINKTLNNMEQLSSRDSDLLYQMNAALREVEKAAASVRELGDYLQQHPNSLLFGTKEQQP